MKKLTRVLSILIWVNVFFIYGLSTVAFSDNSILPADIYAEPVEDLNEWEFDAVGGELNMLNPQKVKLSASSSDSSWAWSSKWAVFSGTVGVQATINMQNLNGEALAGIYSSRIARNHQGNHFQARLLIAESENGYVVQYLLRERDEDREIVDVLVDGQIAELEQAIDVDITLSIFRIGNTIHFVAHGYGDATYSIDDIDDFIPTGHEIIAMSQGQDGLAEAVFSKVNILHSIEEPNVNNLPGVMMLLLDDEE